MIVTPVATAGLLYAVALAWPSESHGHTFPIPGDTFRSEEACIHALPRYDAINQREYGGRGRPTCLVVKQ